MNNDTIIKVEGLYKKFCINQRKTLIYGGLDVFRNMVGFPARRDILRDKEIWALDNLNFEVRKGETLGIIGLNGAGKTTLLRVLSGIYPPDAGRAYVRGPIGALIAAGAGFHPDMTGRENVYLNGAIVGLKKKEIDAKLDEIIEFAELGEFIDTPVRFYSSGMYVRLGFAIAANIRPRVLVIDEVLSVGDLTFQNKCFRKLREMRGSVDAVLFVSHHLDHVRNLCTELIIMDSGKIVYHGDVEEGVIRYQARADDLKQKSLDVEREEQPVATTPGFYDDARLEAIEIGSRKGESNGEITVGDDLVLGIAFEVQRTIERPQFCVSILDDKNTSVIWQIDYDYGVRFNRLDPGRYKVVIGFKRPPLVAGVYRLDFAIRDADTCEMLVKHKRLKSFVIRGQQFSRAIVNCESTWELERITGTG